MNRFVASESVRKKKAQRNDDDDEDEDYSPVTQRTKPRRRKKRAESEEEMERVTQEVDAAESVEVQSSSSSQTHGGTPKTRFKGETTTPVPGKKRRYVLNQDGSQKTDADGNFVTARGGGRYVTKRMRRHEYLLWSLNWFGNNPSPMTKEELAIECIAATQPLLKAGQTLDVNNKADRNEIINLIHVHERGDIKRFMDGRTTGAKDPIEERVELKQAFNPAGKLLPWGTWSPGDPFRIQAKEMIMPPTGGAASNPIATAFTSSPTHESGFLGSSQRFDDTRSSELEEAESQSENESMKYIFESTLNDEHFKPDGDDFLGDIDWDFSQIEGLPLTGPTRAADYNPPQAAARSTPPATGYIAPSDLHYDNLSEFNSSVVDTPAGQRERRDLSGLSIGEMDAVDPCNLHVEDFRTWVAGISDQQLSNWLAVHRTEHPWIRD